MTPIVNLHILARRFTQLSKSAFFDPAFKEFAAKTYEATVHVIEMVDVYPDDLVRQFQVNLWNVLQFVNGSRSNDAPHETQYVLRKALKEWVSEDALISSASLEYFNFSLQFADLWGFITTSLSKYDTGGYKPLVVRISSPEAYKHRPVFCIPLFHELGHFIDQYYKISEYSLLINAPPATPTGMHPDYWKQVNLHHRMEYFADLFASCYCGNTTNKSLSAIAPNNPDSRTHPSTAKRTLVVDNFLAGTDDDMVNILQSALANQNQPLLAVRFSIPDVVKRFDDVLTYKISGVDELYGIFAASWDYLHDNMDSRTAPWITNNTNEFVIEKTVNDLTAKSIRNFEITERWKNVPDNGN